MCCDLLNPRAFPRIGRMAALALRSVLHPGAGHPCGDSTPHCAESLHRTGRLAMARGALQLAVSAEQREMRFLRVIETPQRPAVRRMAALALLAEAALVHVVVRVTIDAGRWRPAERERRVALRTAHDPVQPQQREVGQVVIEGDLGTPARLAVTALAPALSLPPCGSSLRWQPTQSLASFCVAATPVWQTSQSILACAPSSGNLCRPA